MKQVSIVLMLLVGIFSSCNGQVPVNGAHGRIEAYPLFINIEADTVTTLGENLMMVYQDRKGNFWFGSWESGLYQYNGRNILHYNTENGLPSNRIEEIKEDHLGNVYFNTSRGIIRFNGKSFFALATADTANSQWKLQANDLWFKAGWNAGTVLRWDGDLLYQLQLPKIKIGEDYISRNPNSPNPYTVYSIYKDRKGNIWFGTGALGAFRYNGKTFDWITEGDVAEIYNAPSQPSNGVRSIVEDKEGSFWFNAAFRYKIYEDQKPSDAPSNSPFYHREKSIGSLDGKKDGTLVEYLSIAKDTAHGLCIATYDSGVWHYDGKNIRHYPITDSSGEIHLFSVYCDRAGSLWLGTPESGVYKFNGTAFERFQPVIQ